MLDITDNNAGRAWHELQRKSCGKNLNFIRCFRFLAYLFWKPIRNAKCRQLYINQPSFLHSPLSVGSILQHYFFFFHWVKYIFTFSASQVGCLLMFDTRKATRSTSKYAYRLHALTDIKQNAIIRSNSLLRIIALYPRCVSTALNNTTTRYGAIYKSYYKKRNIKIRDEN